MSKLIVVIHTVEYYTTIKIIDVKSHAKTWMTLTNNTKEKSTLCDSIYVQFKYKQNESMV